MRKLTIHDKRSDLAADALIPLGQVLKRLNLDEVDAWLVRNLDVYGIDPFDVASAAFEDLTDRLTYGVLLTPSELRIFQAENVEVVAGEFTGLSFRNLPVARTRIDAFRLLRLSRIDAAWWECETEDGEIIARITREFLDVRHSS